MRGPRSLLPAWSFLAVVCGAWTASGGAAAQTPAATSAPAAPGPAALADAPPLYLRPGQETALDRYLKRPDAHYAWRLEKSIPGDGFESHVLELTSQAWRTPAEVDRPVWKHWLTVVVPTRVVSDKALLFIGGGGNDRPPPEGPDRVVEALVRTTGSIAAELRMTPNQPLVFGGDGQSRVEDDLIAYTWDKFLVTGDETWPARLPMVKSAVRALDAVQEFAATPAGGEHAIRGFVVAGGSKRGWTTWLTGAVDRRVVAVVPIVIDVLNLRPSMQNHYAAYGFWAPAVGDYVHHRIVHRSHLPEYLALLAIEDPYSYRDRLELPKFIVNATGDEFFCPDSSQFYFADLPGEKYLRYVPNAQHSLAGADAVESIQAFYQSILEGRPRPRFSWTNEADGSIVVQVDDPPTEVKLWQATNPRARDFRLETLGPAFSAAPIAPDDDGRYVARVAAPTSGYTAYFVELTFPSGGPYPFKFTTNVRVVPDVLPFAERAQRWSAGEVDP